LAHASCRILIADDHAAIRRGVCTLLELQENWQVVAEAENGRDALRLARETRPDIAILDYALPQMSGLELTHCIKGELPRTEVLIYTMHDQQSIVTEVLRAGARSFVLKSDPGMHLISAVEALGAGKPFFSPAISEALVDCFIQQTHGRSSTDGITPREREVIELIAKGKINKQIAYTLEISTKTVETHRAAVMQKLKLRTTADLVRYAVRNDIIQI
jgi:DNA-binding NarL/FixJ family response regulator